MLGVGEGVGTFKGGWGDLYMIWVAVMNTSGWVNVYNWEAWHHYCQVGWHESR